MLKRRVVVTGIGIVSPLGIKRETTWSNVLAGVSGADYIRAFDASTWPTRFACEVKDFALTDYMVSERLRAYLNRATRFAMGAAHEAILDSGCTTGINPERFGIAVGANIGAMHPEDVHAFYSNGGSQSSSLASRAAIIRNHPGTLAGVLAEQWKALGPLSTVQTACSSSGQAVGLAYRQIQRGESDVMLAGGADSLAAEMLLAGFCLLGALSTRNDDPAAASRPFDIERDGFVAGEGAAMIILEDLNSAVARGARIYGEVVGYGETESAYRITDLPPDGRGLVEAMEDAVSEAGISWREVNYINAHGTSTQLNDRVEALAIDRVFGERDAYPLVSSTKSETGHLISAAGALEFAFCALALRDQIAPPTRNLQKSDCAERVNLVSSQAQPAKLRAAMSNSVGFGGSNCSIIIRQWEGR